ncbi:uncharacterized protein LOC143291239 isoform X2 [Babylonia areolata]|uniref:uncharacterized protein LOC143291239 isoform X2 n=1 Tax=Babylonia areolata TaxID=304850 RepID=UPI003FCF3FCB
MRVLLLVLLGLSAGLCGATSLRGTRDPAQDKVGKLTPQQILALCRFFQLPQCTDSQGHSGSAHSSEEKSSSEDDAASLLSDKVGKLTPQQILALCRFFQLPQCTDSQGHSGSAHSSEEKSSSEDDAASLLSGERGVKESTEREICPPWYPECLKRR